MVRQIILTGFAVLLPVGVQAQGRGMMPPVSHSVAVAPRVVMAAPRAGAMQVAAGRPAMRVGTVRPRTTMPAGRVTRRPGTSITRRRFDGNTIGLRPGCNSAPGLGFDAVHQAAICGSGTVGFRGRGLPAFFPFFEGGFFLPGSPAAVEDVSAEEVAQAEAREAEIREMNRRRRISEPVAPPAEPAPQPASTATPEDDRFVFVRRDGTVFFAVAYSWEKGMLSYITSEGLRRTVAEDALDLDATRQFNEQRGLNFRLPA